MDQSLQAITSNPLAVAVAAPAPSESIHQAHARPLLDRIAVLDILRGIALVGMFMVHFNYYEATPLGADPGRMAAFIEKTIGLFFEERFYSIFGMLFGVGFAVQLGRAEARGEPFVGRFLRRLAVLSVFGFIAQGVFGYAVLLGYAIWAVPLLLVRRWPVKALFLLLILCTGSRQIWSVAKAVAASRQPGGIEQVRTQNRANIAAFMAARDSLRAAEQSPSWGTVVAARARFLPRFHYQWTRFPNSEFVLFLMGLIAWRLGLFTRPEEHKRLIVTMMAFGAASAAMDLFAFPLGGMPTVPPTTVLGTIASIAKVNGFSLFRAQWLAFTYIGAVLLLVAYHRVWLQRLSFFSWAGRMALTNYMMQVVLLDVLFTPKGFGLKIPAPLVFPGAIALFVAQVFLSRWWLTHFRLGPLEWVWRSVTYWKVQPLRIALPPARPRLALETAAISD